MGEELRLMFSEVDYKTIFERHLVTLKKWETCLPEAMDSIREDLVDNARYGPILLVLSDNTDTF
jgi:hypothetical protein